MPKKYILYLVKKERAKNGLLPGQIVAVHPEGYEPSLDDRFNHDIIEVPESEYRHHLIDFEMGVDLYYSFVRKCIARIR